MDTNINIDNFCSGFRNEIQFYDGRSYTQENLEYLKKKKIAMPRNSLFYFTNYPKLSMLENGGDSNPYHLFIYMISKLYNIDINDKEIIFYYPASDSLLAEEAMENLPKRFKREKLIRMNTEYIDLPIGQWYAFTIDVDKWTYPYIRNLYAHITEDIKIIPGKYSYISRSYKENTTRKIKNEENIIPMLRKFGFSIYYLELLSFKDQIRLFASSEIIMGPHGAGLTWSLFMNQSSKLFEITLVDESCFKHISDILGIHYARCSCFTQLEQEQTTSNIQINPVEFCKFLEENCS